MNLPPPRSKYPAGMATSSPYATSHKNPTPDLPAVAGTIVDSMGKVIPPTDDLGWQPPTDPMRAGEATARATAMVINREVPQVSTQNGWSIPDVRNALMSLVTGLFDGPAQMLESIMGDSRVHSALMSRTSGLLGRAITFKVPAKYKDDDTANRCCEAWQAAWPQMATEPALSTMQRWGAGLGFAPAQLLWDTSEEFWTPYLQPWHARYTYWHWTFRKFIAITLDGQVPIMPGDGHWVLHEPHGERGWMQGAIRSIAPWWLARNYALRDWARYSERHGMPIMLATTPMGADPAMIAQYRTQLGMLGQESVLQCPVSDDPAIGSFGLDYLEASDQAWEGFKGLIEQCNSEITLSLMGQNLTSEVKEGSLSAARVHADVRQGILEADARSLAATVYNQIARPFAAINFGNPDYAPRTTWDVSPEEDKDVTARALLAFAQAVAAFRQAGEPIDVKAMATLCKVPYAALENVQAQEAQIFAYHLGAGVVTANEVRARLGLEPIDGGDEVLKDTPEAAPV